MPSAAGGLRKRLRARAAVPPPLQAGAGACLLSFPRQGAKILVLLELSLNKDALCSGALSNRTRRKTSLAEEVRKLSEQASRRLRLRSCFTISDIEGENEEL